jgi:hypothetical protein
MLGIVTQLLGMKKVTCNTTVLLVVTWEQFPQKIKATVKHSQMDNI